MNRGINVGIVIVALVAFGALAAWLMAQPPESVAAPAPVERPKPAVAAPPAPAEPAPVAVEPEAETPAPAEPAPAPAPPQPEVLNEETLKGTSWKSPAMEITLLPDHRIQFGQRIPETARWSVEGSRVKMADDKGEVRFFEIEGTKLYFQGSDGREDITRVK